MGRLSSVRLIESRHRITSPLLLRAAEVRLFGVWVVPPVFEQCTKGVRMRLC